MTPTPPPGSLVKVQRMDSVLGDLGHRIGLWLSHPHMLTVSSFRGHPASGLALALILLALCGVVLSLPAGVWMFRRRHHLRSSIRGLVSLSARRDRRKWRKHIGDVEIAGMPAPKPIAYWPVPSGTTLLMRLDGGQNLPKLQTVRANFASQMRCQDVELEPIYHNRGRIFVRIVRRDFLARRFPWPWLNYETTDFFGPIPAGMSVEGKPVYIDLREKNALVGGGMGSGKSWWVHTVVAAAMGDVRVNVWILDGKEGSGFWAWRHSCSGFATNDKDDHAKAYAILAKLEAKINAIYKGFKENDQRTIDWDKAKSIDLLVIDEFLAFMKIPGFAPLLMNLIARGRAAGLIMILTVQRPSSKIVDTDFRELFQIRVAGKSDSAGSKMIMGDGVDADSSEFSGSNPGEMWMLQAPDLTHMRGYSLTDKDLAHLAARAQSLRSKNDATNGSAPNDVAHSGAANGSDTPTPVRSPISPLSLVPSPSPSLSPASSSPSQPLPAVSGSLRPTLTFIALHGPQVASGDIQSGLGISSSTQLARCNRLSALGYVYGARRAAKPGRGAGGRDPMLWSITDLGTAALTAKAAKEAGAQ